VSDEDLRLFLVALDGSHYDVTDWEAEFIASNLTREKFSANQRAIIENMMENYPDI